MIPNKQYKADKNGCFVVPASDLPLKGLPETGVTQRIVVNGKLYQSDTTTYVPSRVLVKLMYSHRDGTSRFFFRLTQWDSEKDGGAFVPMNTPLDGVYGSPQNFRLWALRDKAKGNGVKPDFAALNYAMVHGTADGFVVVTLPHVSITDPTDPLYGKSDRKPLFLVLSMLQAPYGQSLQTMQLLGMASKDFWEGLSDFFTIFE